MTDPNDRFDALLDAMLTRPEPTADQAPGQGVEVEPDDGQDD